jgi:phosphatidylglycerophosphate synthase
MFDTRLRRLIDPPLDRVARLVDALPVSANAVTIAGLVVGLLAAAAIAAGWFALALAGIAVNRLFDGLDGAIARRKGTSDLGGYYDIVFDFLFYGAVPLAFAIHDPARNALPAAMLLAGFYANGATFLTFAIVAAKRGITTAVQGRKSIYYFAGIAEGFETIAVFCLMVVFPAAFWWLAPAFAALCLVSAGARILSVRERLLAAPQREDGP